MDPVTLIGLVTTGLSVANSIASKIATGSLATKIEDALTALEAVLSNVGTAITLLKPGSGVTQDQVDALVAKMDADIGGWNSRHGG